MHDGIDHHHGDDIEKNIVWIMDNIELLSAGIDIGTSGTQVIFSRLKLQRKGEDLTSRYVIVSRESFYQSSIYFTPYIDDSKIDDEKIAEMIDECYKEAGLTPDEINAGAVILTGEAIRRENARAIGERIAESGGDFVCAIAGHNMESLLAAYGSGAARRSFDEKKKILNIDIGGGTTKFAIVENGKVIETAAFYIGGRLIVKDDEENVIRIDPGGKNIADHLGIEIEIGKKLTKENQEKITNWMANAVIGAVSNKLSPETENLYLTNPLTQLFGIEEVCFSGGVGEYVYSRETTDFGDLGKGLGSQLRNLVDETNFPWPLIEANECIRATVIGASEHSVQVSGNTLYLSDESLIPRKNLQALHPNCDLSLYEIDKNAVAASIQSHFKQFDLIEGEKEVALSFSWDGPPAYERIINLAKGIKLGLTKTIENNIPIVIVLDGDIAQTVGSILKEELHVKSEVLVIDGIRLNDFDFVDIGKMLFPSNTIPVTIKSLLFQMENEVEEIKQ